MIRTEQSIADSEHSVLRTDTFSFESQDSPSELMPFQPIAHYARYFSFQRWKHQNSSTNQVDSRALSHHLQLKERYRLSWGDFLPTDEVVDTLVTMLRSEFGYRSKALDAGSGSGFFSRELCRRGVDTYAVDIEAIELRSTFTSEKYLLHQRDAIGNAFQFVNHEYAVIIATQPPYLSPMLRQIAVAMKSGQLLIVEGEPWRSDEEREFWRLICMPNWIARDDMKKRLNESHMTFIGHNDHWHVLQKI